VCRLLGSALNDGGEEYPPAAKEISCFQQFDRCGNAMPERGAANESMN